MPLATPRFNLYVRLSDEETHAAQTSQEKDPELGISLGREWMHRNSAGFGPVPPLFHYTGAHGMRGILKSDTHLGQRCAAS